ncbi:hypothetical protein V8C86DRAFT_2449152 [Haematococcus lacustris]
MRVWPSIPSSLPASPARAASMQAATPETPAVPNDEGYPAGLNSSASVPLKLPVAMGAPELVRADRHAAKRAAVSRACRSAALRGSSGLPPRRQSSGLQGAVCSPSALEPCSAQYDRRAPRGPDARAGAADSRRARALTRWRHTQASSSGSIRDQCIAASGPATTGLCTSDHITSRHCTATPKWAASAAVHCLSVVCIASWSSVSEASGQVSSSSSTSRRVARKGTRMSVRG